MKWPEIRISSNIQNNLKLKKLLKSCTNYVCNMQWYLKFLIHTITKIHLYFEKYVYLEEYTQKEITIYTTFKPTVIFWRSFSDFNLSFNWSQVVIFLFILVLMCLTTKTQFFFLYVIQLFLKTCIATEMYWKSVSVAVCLTFCLRVVLFLNFNYICQLQRCLKSFM